jgi:hypothetical protein
LIDLIGVLCREVLDPEDLAGGIIGVMVCQCPPHDLGGCLVEIRPAFLHQASDGLIVKKMLRGVSWKYQCHSVAHEVPPGNKLTSY